MLNNTAKVSFCYFCRAFTSLYQSIIRESKPLSSTRFSVQTCPKFCPVNGKSGIWWFWSRNSPHWSAHLKITLINNLKCKLKLKIEKTILFFVFRPLSHFCENRIPDELKHVRCLRLRSAAACSSQLKTFRHFPAKLIVLDHNRICFSLHWKLSKHV